MDPLLAAAAAHVVVQTEAVVGNAEIRRAPERTSYWRSAAVVPAARGTHPYAGPAIVRDERHLVEYADAAGRLRAGKREPLEAYLDRYVHGCPTHDDYVERIGRARLDELEVARR